MFGECAAFRIEINIKMKNRNMALFEGKMSNLRGKMPVFCSNFTQNPVYAGFSEIYMEDSFWENISQIFFHWKPFMLKG